MRLLLSWLRDFVDVKASVDDIAETLGLRGFEVASVERLGADDGVIDFEVTANRPDALSVAGLAREVATAYDLPLTLPAPPKRPTGESPHVAVAILDAELCPRYAAAVADVERARSPERVTYRLEAAGVRAISPLVDITNYVLMELGQPLHAFDLDKLEDQSICVRRAAIGESLVTLDGVNRKLDPDMLVIADARRPQAVAGVMGGADAELSGATRRTVFESAYFKPASVRRTSKRLGLKTEASFRFERGADIAVPVRALERALQLMEEIGAGRALGPIVDRYPQLRALRQVKLRRDRLAAVLGMAVPDRDVERILRALALETTSVTDGWETVVPTFRVDLEREVDLIEEVGRHYGFDRLSPVFPPMTEPAQPPDPKVVRDRWIRQNLTAIGLNEAITFGFIEARAAHAFVNGSKQDSVVGVANPLSGKFDALRPSLLPGLVDGVAHNRRHGRRDVALFEIGARFTAFDGETQAIGIAWTGARTPEHWTGTSRDIDFFDVKGAVELLVDGTGLSIRFAPVDVPYLVPGQAAAVMAGDVSLGIVGRVAPEAAEERGVPRHDAVFVAELDLDRMWTLRHAPADTVRPLPRFPAVVRDLSIVVGDALPAEIIRGTIQAAGRSGRAPLADIRFFDRYKGQGLAGDAVSLSVRLTFQAPDRTLTDAEVQESFDVIVAALVRDHGARQR
jgi:phenylalanyl-tRNA synthetase beta chain